MTRTGLEPEPFDPARKPLGHRVSHSTGYLSSTDENVPKKWKLKRQLAFDFDLLCIFVHCHRTLTLLFYLSHVTFIIMPVPFASLNIMLPLESHRKTLYQFSEQHWMKMCTSVKANRKVHKRKLHSNKVYP